jgi:hypothetical protein
MLIKTCYRDCQKKKKNFFENLESDTTERKAGYGKQRKRRNLKIHIFRNFFDFSYADDFILIWVQMHKIETIFVNICKSYAEFIFFAYTCNVKARGDQGKNSKNSFCRIFVIFLSIVVEFLLFS